MSRILKRELKLIFDRLFDHFGPQGWWPGESPLEIAVGAILTQNTNWKNVERALHNLKKAGLLNENGLRECGFSELAMLIKPAGYFNQKAKKLKEFINFLFLKYDGKMENMRDYDTWLLREELLSVKGIGRETADSILLYALDKPVFVVDAYTYRFALRHGFIPEDADYEELRLVFQDNLEQDVSLFKEFHALIVRLGKVYCKKVEPLCSQCPLGEMLDGR